MDTWLHSLLYYNFPKTTVRITLGFRLSVSRDFSYLFLFCSIRSGSSFWLMVLFVSAPILLQWPSLAIFNRFFFVTSSPISLLYPLPMTLSSVAHKESVYLSFLLFCLESTLCPTGRSQIIFLSFANRWIRTIPIITCTNFVEVVILRSTRPCNLCIAILSVSLDL